MTDEWVAHEFEHAGLKVKILGEPYIEEWMNPRDSVDGLLGVMMTAHPNYNLGGGKWDEDVGRDGPDTSVDCETCEGEGYVPWDGDEGHPRYDDGTMTCQTCGGSGTVELSLYECLKRKHGARVVLPLFLLDHSGLSMTAGQNMGSMESRGRFMGDDAGWDTSTVGVIFDTNETRKECGWEDRTDEEIEEDLRLEVKLYDAYLQNQVYLYVIEDEEGETLDSCGGFLELKPPWSEEASVFIEAKHAAEACRREIERENREAAEMAARDIETVNG